MSKRLEIATRIGQDDSGLPFARGDEIFDLHSRWNNLYCNEARWCQVAGVKFNRAQRTRGTDRDILLHSRVHNMQKTMYRKSFFLFAFSARYKIRLSDTCIRAVNDAFCKMAFRQLLFAQKRVASFDKPLLRPFIHPRNCKRSPLKRESPHRDRSSSGEVIPYKYRFLKRRLLGRQVGRYIRHDGSTKVIFFRISLAVPFFEYSIRPDVNPRVVLLTAFSALRIPQTRSRMPRRTIFSNLFHQVGSPRAALFLPSSLSLSYSLRLAYRRAFRLALNVMQTSLAGEICRVKPLSRAMILTTLYEALSAEFFPTGCLVFYDSTILQHS